MADEARTDNVRPQPRRLAVIVPVRNEGQNIPLFYERARPVLDGLPGLAAWTLVFVNNASEDESLDVIKQLRARDPHVQVMTLSRNFGYHQAMVAGLSHIDSDVYGIIDVDCEDPPEMLRELYAGIQAGYAVVYGIRSRRQELKVITFGRKVFYGTLRRLADADFVEWMSEFALITRQVRNAILVPRTTYPFLRAEMGYVGFRRLGIRYVRAKRQHGASHFNFLGMIRFAVGGLLASSTFPLRLVLYLAAVIGPGFVLMVWWRHPSLVEAGALAALTSLGFLLIALPLSTLYLARTYKNVMARPVFVIDDTRTFLDAPAGAGVANPALLEGVL